MGGADYGAGGHALLLPLSVTLDTPLWLMAGFAVVPLMANIIAEDF